MVKLAALLAAGVLALAAPAAARADPAPLREADYWAAADTLVGDLEPTWDDRAGAFRDGPRTLSTHLNVAMLLTYSLAARAGHVGPARRDDRARRILSRLLRPPAYATPTRRRASQVHRPGWRADLIDTTAAQHVSTDARVLEALAAAYGASAALGLNDATRRLVRQRVCAVARSAFFATPRLNQVNWLADAYAACARVGGGSDLLRGKYREWLIWFLAHARQPARRGATPNLTSGLGLHYLPDGRRAVANRMPTTEYGNIVVTVLGTYDTARAHGMRPIPRELIALAKRWQTRVLDGDWTQAGYPNWDTGLGFARWHLRRYWGWATEGLLTIATTRGLRASPQVAAQARTTLDNALRLFLRFRSDPQERNGSTSFGIGSTAADRIRDPMMTSARFAAIAARAALAGLGSAPALTSAPSVFGHDPDVGRLAVSTRRYSAAITPPSVRASYGGAELSRLFDASGRPVSSTGGSGGTLTAFGLRLLRGGRVVAETQPGQRWIAAPTIVAAAVKPGGGRFTAIRTAQTVVGTGPVRVRVEHRFETDAVTVRHFVLAAAGTRATLRFPAYGEATFRTATGSGPGVTVTSTPIPAGRTLHVVLTGGRGYTVVFTRPLPAEARVRVVAARLARSAPRTLATLVVEFPVRSARLLVEYRLVADPV